MAVTNNDLLKKIKLIQDDADLAFEKSEDELLLKALQSTHTERFYFATRLYKINKMLQKAKVTHFTGK